MAVPAPPTLASELWLKQQDRPQEGIDEEEPKTSPNSSPKLQTGVKAIDKQFDGGFAFGAVHGITSRVDSDAADLVQGLLAAHLLSGSDATATIVESTNYFDVRKLYHALQTISPSSEEAMKALARLRISKVFDYQGMTEALAEMHQNVCRADLEIENGEAAPKATIEDSEDEEDLLAAPSPAKGPSAADLRRDHKPKPLLVVNSISHVVAPAIQNNYVKGQAMLSTVMRTISRLTYTQSMCTFVFGNARSVREDETLSILKAANFRPSVGVGVGYLFDVHLYLHEMRLRKPAAGQQNATVNVLSAVDDKQSGSFGTSVAFAYNAAGVLQDIS